MKINNKNEIGDESNKWFVGGQRMLQSKDAFSVTSESDHFNFDSFLASVVSNNIKERVASTFLFNKKKSYLLKQEDIFKAIDKIGITNNYLILGCCVPKILLRKI